MDPIAAAQAELELRKRSGEYSPPVMWEPQPGAQSLAYHSLADELYYGGAAGGGKALELDTKIPTLGGWSTMGEIQIGDAVYDDLGSPCRVIAKSPVYTDHKCYKIIFSDGTEITADADHKWKTFTAKERDRLIKSTPEWREKRQAKRPSRGKGKRPDLVKVNKEREYEYKMPPEGEIRTTQEIYDTQKIKGRNNHSVDVAPHIAGWFGLEDLLIAPYVLGAWLGDGKTAAGSITNGRADREILDYISEHYEISPRKDPNDYGVLGLQIQLKELGLLGYKHIPQVYLRADVNIRISLLQGLMDTDGYADPRGQCEFTTINERLAQDFKELLGTLGIKSSISIGDATLNGKWISKKHRIKFVTEIPAFRLQRKLKRQKREGFRGTHKKRYIVSVEEVDPVPVQCIAVDSPSNMFLITDAFIPTHNTDLIIGTAPTEHTKSIIFRRIWENLKEIEERAREIYGDYGQYNSMRRMWRFDNGKRVDFGSVQYEQDKNKYRGRDHDLKAYDEITEFTESQYLFLNGWLRTVIPNQRTRIIATGNPPDTEEGRWVIRRWAPWLDPKHPNPAEPGELRWYLMIDGKDTEMPNSDPVELEDPDTGEKVLRHPKSRTFIPAGLADNKYLAESGEYAIVLDNLPEPLRSQLKYGDFTAGVKPDAWQVIPTAWIELAMDRWQPLDADKRGELSSMGVDTVRGGADMMVMSKRYGAWFDELIIEEGKEVTDGSIGAGIVVKALGEENAPINVDVIGVGASTVDFLNAMSDSMDEPLDVVPINFAEGSGHTDKSGKLRMRNLRAEAYWRMREALDPASGENIALPPDDELKADLAAPRYKITTSGVLIEEKQDIIKRIGRSPDRADAVVMANLIQSSGIYI